MNISRFTKFALVLAIVALIVGFSACDQIGQLLVPAPPEMPPDTGLPGEIIVGVSLPLDDENGPLYGLPMKRGFELAQAEINHYGGPQITFIIEDDQSTIEGAKAAFDKLIHQDGVSIYHRHHLLNSARSVSSNNRRERSCMF